MRRHMNKSVIYLLLVSNSAYAEVSDKIPTQSSIWLAGISIGLLLVLLLVWSKWINVLAIPIVIFFFMFAFGTLHSDIGPAIIKEQGVPYIVALYGSASFAFVCLVLGNILRARGVRAHINKPNRVK